jgi:putative ABC transport system permease protein
MLLAPLAAWFGAVLLGVRLFLAGAGRIPVPGGGRFGPLLRGTLGRSVKRRPRGLALGIIAVSLAQAFGISTILFVATYHAEKAADARFVVGSDLRVSPSPANPLPARFGSQLRVPGVAAVAPVMFHVQNATIGNDAKDLAAVDVPSLRQTADLRDSFFPNGSAAAAMAALEREPAGLLIDSEAAAASNIQTGDSIKVLLKDVAGGQVEANMRAVGTFRQMPGFPQHTDLLANLSYLQAATGLDAIDFFYVRASDPSPTGVARAAAAIRSGPGRTASLRVDTTGTSLNRDQSSLAALNLNGLGSLDQLYVALISAAGVAIFVFGLLLQRPREYLTMRALGMRTRQLAVLLAGEAAVVAVLALLTGAAVGTAMAFLFVQILRPVFTLPPDRLTFPVDQVLSLAALGVGAMAVSALAAGALLRRLQPMELLREE